MSKKRTKPLDGRSTSVAIVRMREEGLKLRREVKAEEARADALEAKRPDHFAHAKKALGGFSRENF